MRLTTPAFLLALLLTTDGAAQTQSQTLPSGWENQIGDYLIHDVVNDTNSDRWHWHYDASEFDATGPILITEIYVRASSDLSLVSAFNFGDFEVTLAEATTDYQAAAAFFNSNTTRRVVVKDGNWSGGPTFQTVGPLPQWIPFELERPYLFDPSRGNDLVIEVKKCHQFSTSEVNWGVAMDAEIRSSFEAPIGGSRRGNATNCLATSANFFDDDVAPIVLIDYRPAWQTLPAGYEELDGNSSTSFPMNTSSQQIWQWHYDSTNALPYHPIMINQIWVRPSTPTATIAPFTISDLEVTLIEASTLHTIGNHDPIFANNIDRATVVRSGPLSSSGVQPAAGSTGEWISLDLEAPFYFDPTGFPFATDLIVQIKKCGSDDADFIMDGVSGSQSIGGNRYGHTSNCNSTSSNNNGNYFVPIIRLDFSLPDVSADSAITSFPWFEDFESVTGTPTTDVPAGWTNVPGENAGGTNSDWFLRSGPTSSTNTGPPTDHTTGNAGVYAYVEDSTPGEYHQVILLSPHLNLPSSISNPVLRFRSYSQNANGVGGAGENLLHVDVVQNSGPALALDVVSPIGSGPGEWRINQADLTPFINSGSFRIRFRSSSDNATFVHDIAIDDVYVGPGGTIDDLSLTTEVNAAFDRDDPQKTAIPFDLWRWRIETPDLGLVFGNPYLFGHLYPDGTTPSSTTIPELYFPLNLTVLLYDPLASPLGFFTPLTPFGLEQITQVPAGLSAHSLVVQAFVVSGGANNGIYGISLPHHLDLQ